MDVDPITNHEQQRRFDEAAEASAEEGMRQGLLDIIEGRCRPAADVLEEIRREYRIPSST